MWDHLPDEPKIKALNRSLSSHERTRANRDDSLSSCLEDLSCLKKELALTRSLSSHRSTLVYSHPKLDGLYPNLGYVLADRRDNRVGCKNLTIHARIIT